MREWDTRSEMPEMVYDRINREQPALQEYDWTQGQRGQRPVPIAIIESLIAELGDDD